MMVDDTCKAVQYWKILLTPNRIPNFIYECTSGATYGTNVNDGSRKGHCFIAEREVLLLPTVT
jgi:hypothetical protein